MADSEPEDPQQGQGDVGENDDNIANSRETAPEEAETEKNELDEAETTLSKVESNVEATVESTEPESEVATNVEETNLETEEMHEEQNVEDKESAGVLSDSKEAEGTTSQRSVHEGLEDEVVVEEIKDDEANGEMEEPQEGEINEDEVVEVVGDKSHESEGKEEEKVGEEQEEQDKVGEEQDKVGEEQEREGEEQEEQDKVGEEQEREGEGEEQEEQDKVGEEQDKVGEEQDKVGEEQEREGEEQEEQEKEGEEEEVEKEDGDGEEEGIQRDESGESQPEPDAEENVNELDDHETMEEAIDSEVEDGEADERDENFAEHLHDASATLVDYVDDMSAVDEESDVGNESQAETAEKTDSLAEPIEFKLRTIVADDDEFTLDNDLDENRIVALMDMNSEASDTSLSTSNFSWGEQAAPTVRPARQDAVAPEMLTADDRDRLMEQYRALMAERTNLTRTNTVLQKRLMEHFKRRRTSIMVRNTEESLEVEQRYANKLADFNEAKTEYETELTAFSEELAALALEEEKQRTELQAALDELINLEREAGNRLVDSNACRLVSEKQMEKMLQRQSACVFGLVEQRINFIKHRDEVEGKEAAIKEIEDLGEGTKMCDYEQLRIEHQNLSDKVEERDEELSKLRLRVAHLHTAIAHFREKSYSIVSQIEFKTELLKAREEKLDCLRSDLAKQKTLRDRLRADMIRETTDSGLLTKPHLLRDFEETLDERDALREQLEELRKKGAAELRQLVVLRENFERSSATNEDDIPKRKPTFKEKIEQRLEEKKARREAELNAIAKVQMEADEEFFQMK